MKKVYFFSALMLSALALHAADPALNFEGDGSASSPYIIKNATDVVALATACNGASSTTSGHYSGKYFTLISDIDMSGVEGFIGIATAPADKSTSTTTYHFDGIFDGRGYRIKNMTIKGVVYKDDGSVNTSTTANGSRRYCGFFGALGVGGKVSNLIIDASCKIEAYSNVGGVVGYLGTDAFVNNCANFADITCMYSDAGGIVGAQSTSANKTGGIINCFNAGKILCNNSEAGGIVGKTSYGEVTNCANIGEVIGNNFNPCQGAFLQTKIGGIIGYSSYTAISNCFNAGDVYAMKETAGGIAGVVAQTSTVGSMKSCLNVGFVYGALGYNCGYVAAISNSTSTKLTNIQNCYYDAQMLNNLFGANSIEFANDPKLSKMQTSQLTNGQKLAGLDSWIYKTGSYPVPANLDFPELYVAAATFVSIPEGQNADLLTTSATASTGSEISFTRPTDLFTISGSNITAHPSAGNGVGVFTLTNGSFTRHLLLSTYTIPFSGQGNAASPYLINDKEDLIKLADLSNNMRLHWNGMHFRLTSDLDMTNENRFMGICVSPDTVNNFGSSYRLQFCGVFDGDNHKISNLDCEWVKFNPDSTYIDWRKGGYYISGFFGTLGQGAEIKNLTIDRSCKYKVYMYSGGIASMSRGRAKIENCHVGAEITAYTRYVGGIIAEDNSDAPLEITNCSFTGKILANYDYVGGIIGYSSCDSTIITSCVNAGSIVAYKFDKVAVGTNSTSQLNRIGGIAGAIRGKLQNCASYGPITVTPHPYTTTTKMLGCAGLVGQMYNYSPSTSLSNNFTSSQVYITAPFSGDTQVGSIVGDYWVNAKNIYGNNKANYADSTLCAATKVIGHNTPDTIAAPASFHGLPTADFTSGVAIDSLAQYFTFEAGYYPIPKAFASNADIRAAAATFIKIGEQQGGGIATLKPGAVCEFNNVMPLTGSLEDGTVFYIKNNALKMRNVTQEADDILTLTNGWFSTFYPIHKTIGLGTDNITPEGIDMIISTEYYTPAGVRVLRPAPGSTVITIEHTLSGKTITNKRVIR